MEEFRKKDKYRYRGKEDLKEFIGITWVVGIPTLLIYGVVTWLNLPESVIEVLSNPNPWWKVIPIVVINGIIPLWLLLVQLFMYCRLIHINIIK